MGDRKKVGIIYEYNENWIGGTYYIQNLISALNSAISDADKPTLYIYTEKDEYFEQLKNITHYPYLKRGSYYAKRSILQRFINKTCKLLLNKEPYSYLNKEVDVVFPAINETMFRPSQKLIYWIPDFQEHYLPEFFDKNDIIVRKEYQKFILSKPNNLLFSSLAVQSDFNKIYPNSIVKQFVLPFAVSQPNKKNLKNCLSKYDITAPYFICCNQFWKHKNHITVLEAIKILKEKGENPYVVFTGKEQDHRHPDYFKQIKDTVLALGIESNVSFLGFIDRDDQLSLMNNSVAVIQPSLFEGWSTVVEDAKSLNASIIASDIEVHKEQLKTYAKSLFFSPNNIFMLSKNMSDLLKGDYAIENKYNYANAIKNFGNGFMKIVDSA